MLNSPTFGPDVCAISCASALPSLVGPDQLTLTEDVPCHCGEQCLLIEACLDLERRVEGVELEVVVVHAVTLRGRGAAVAHVAEGVLAFERAGRNRAFVESG